MTTILNKIEVLDRLKNKIIEGDSGDGIPSVLMEDNHYTTGLRASPLNKKRRETFMNMDISALEQNPNFVRNRRLIDFSNIPQDIQDAISVAYDAAKPKSKAKLMPYFVSKGLAKQLEKLGDY